MARGGVLGDAILAGRQHIYIMDEVINAENKNTKQRQLQGKLKTKLLGKTLFLHNNKVKEMKQSYINEYNYSFFCAQRKKFVHHLPMQMCNKKAD